MKEDLSFAETFKGYYIYACSFETDLVSLQNTEDCVRFGKRKVGDDSPRLPKGKVRIDKSAYCLDSSGVGGVVTRELGISLEEVILNSRTPSEEWMYGYKNKDFTVNKIDDEWVVYNINSLETK